MPFIGKQPSTGFSSIAKDDFTPDGSTTAFTLSRAAASANDVAVFVGNVRQEPTDAYSVSGTTLTMTSAPASGVNFYALHLGTVESTTVPAAGTTVPGSFGVASGLTVDNDGATVLTVDRATSDGDIVEFQKDDTPVGSIGNPFNTALYITGPGSNGAGLVFQNNDVIQPARGGARSDDTQDLGTNTFRFKDLYLSGGVYLGGTTSANFLDDYEEGDYTATITPDSGSVSLYGIYNQLSYTKVGRVVTVMGQLVPESVSSPSGVFTVNLPFAVADLTDLAGRSFMSVVSYFNGTGITNGYYDVWARALEGTSQIQFYGFEGTAINSAIGDWIGSGSDIIINITYFTSA